MDKKLRQAVVQFDYFSDNYNRFADDFYEYSNMSLPLTFINDDILHSMAGAQKNYFVLSARNSHDKNDHVFMFKVRVVPDAQRIRVYEYVGHRIA